MALTGFRAQNHPQQTRRWGAGDEVDDRATHPLIYAELDELHGPHTIDVAAAAHNTKCSRYFTRDQDGLSQNWSGERVWCNPPYSNIAPWIRKAWDTWSTTTGITMLLPGNRTEQQWWQLMVEPYRDRPASPLTTRFLAGRIRFLKPGQTAVGPNQRPPFGCVVLVWRAPDDGVDAALTYRPDDIRGGLFDLTAPTAHNPTGAPTR